MKARLNIDTNTLSNSNLLTENLKLFSTTTSNFDQNLKQKIFNNLLSPKKAKENIKNSKFETFKLNMLIKGKNLPVSPQRVTKDQKSSPRKNNFNSNEWKDEIQFLK
jgi:hypothetical protein